MHILLAADLPWPGGGWGGHRYVASQSVVQVTLLPLLLPSQATKKEIIKLILPFCVSAYGLGSRECLRSKGRDKAVVTRHIVAFLCF